MAKRGLGVRLRYWLGSRLENLGARITNLGLDLLCEDQRRNPKAPEWAPVTELELYTPANDYLDSMSVYHKGDC